MLINIYIFSLQNLKNLKWHHISFIFADQNFKQFLKYVILIFMELINRYRFLNDEIIAHWLKFEEIMFYLPS